MFLYFYILKKEQIIYKENNLFMKHVILSDIIYKKSQEDITMKEELNGIKEDIKDVLLLGLGALSLTGEKALELKNQLFEKGKELYSSGKIKNEELKRNIKEKIREKVSEETTKEDILNAIRNMTDEEKKEIIEALGIKDKESEE